MRLRLAKQTLLGLDFEASKNRLANLLKPVVRCHAG